MEHDLRWKATSKDLKVEYLINHCLDFPQILNLGSGDQTSNERQQIMEEDLKIIKVEYLSNH